MKFKLRKIDVIRMVTWLGFSIVWIAVNVFYDLSQAQSLLVMVGAFIAIIIFIRPKKDEVEIINPNEKEIQQD